VELINELGRVYDGDPRIGFIEVGFLGHWGEWHTYPDPSLFPDVKVQDRILLAFNASFTKTALLVRYPDVTGTQKPSSIRIGFHDDSFGYDTLIADNWGFMQKMIYAGATQRWKDVPIGGEVYPPCQQCIFDADPQGSCDTKPEKESFTQCAMTTHASWQWDSAAFVQGYSGANLKRALTGALLLGYQYYISYINVEQKCQSSTSGLLLITLNITNTGIATFYYPLSLVLTSSKTVYTLYNDLKSLLPSESNIIRQQIGYTNNGSNSTVNLAFNLSSPILSAAQPIVFAINESGSNGAISFTVPLSAC